jgi:hypothetical protein
MYCQNRLCHYNNTTDRLRAKKSPEPYYVNRTAKGYFYMFCSQGCLMEYFDMYKDRILRAIGEQGKRTRLKTDPTPNEAWSNHADYNLTAEQGYYEARQRFYETWINNHVRD